MSKAYLADGLQITAPLVTRLIIQQLNTAHTFAAVRASGTSTEGLSEPPSQAYGIGLALGLFAMLWIAGLCLAQAEQRLFTIGYMLRSAVSHRRLLSRRWQVS